MKYLLALAAVAALSLVPASAEAFGGRRNRVNVVKVVAVQAAPVIVAQAVVAPPVILHQKAQAVQVVANHNCGALSFVAPVAVVQQVNHGHVQAVQVQAVNVGHSCGLLY